MKHKIGIIGGVGPMAGINLARKLVKSVAVEKDQDHIPWVLMNLPDEIDDRTEYLMGKVEQNPGIAIAKQILQLEQIGCTVAGIACITAHAPEIFNEILSVLSKEKSNIKVIHAIEETVKHMLTLFPAGQKKEIRIGILGTTGTYLTKLYSSPLEEAGFVVIDPGRPLQDKIHQAIYDLEFGIKACSDPIDPRSAALLNEAISFYGDNSASALLFGCTEIAVAENVLKINNIEIIQPMLILARILSVAGNIN